MGLAEELYYAMLDVGYTAKRYKIPELPEHMISTARKCLPIWREKEHTLPLFARQVLRIPNNLRTSTAQLPEPVAAACWRLIALLEYIADETEIN